MDEPSATFETACAAKWVCEGGICGEVCVDGVFLVFGRALGETVDYVAYVLDWVVHCGWPYTIIKTLEKMCWSSSQAQWDVLQESRELLSHVRSSKRA